MIKPEPESFEALLIELLVERYGPARAVRQEHVDSPAEIQARRKVLNEAMADAPELAEVVPLRRGQDVAA